MAESKRGIVDQGVGEDNNLDIFEMITNTSELIMELINKKFLIFKHYQVDVKDFKFPLQWICFTQLVYMLNKILVIIGSKLRQR